MTREEIHHLAELARIELDDKEADSLNAEISEILAYVDQIKEMASDAPVEQKTGPNFNVLREDVNPHKEGIYTEDLLKAAPERAGQYVKVKKILDNE